MSTPSEINGLSVIICCYNSAGRLGPTLAHLASQEVPDGVGYEVLVIDNASTDETAEVARRSWPAGSPHPLRIIREREPGLSHARRRGLLEARFEAVSFVDDDNWVCQGWVRIVHELFSEDPQLGACGGPSEGVYESPPPDWFHQHQGNFAVGEQYAETADVSQSPDSLWGAGLSLRKSAWIDIRETGIQPNLSDRKGSGLTSGGDHELCFGLILGGWKIRYDSRLRIRHYIPPGRMSWSYLRKLYRGAGWSSAWLDPYREELGIQSRNRWMGAAPQLTFALLRNPPRFLRCLFFPMEGNPLAATHELLVGRLLALLFHWRSIARVRTELSRFRSDGGRLARGERSQRDGTSPHPSHTLLRP